MKFNVGENWNVGLEVGLRKTFTDYLDDVSGTYPDNQYLAHEKGELSAALSNRSYEDIRTGHSKVGLTDTEMRGNPDNLDAYIFGGLTVTYTILQSHCYRF